MGRKRKSSEVMVLSAAQQIVPPAPRFTEVELQALIARAVKQRVDEILAENAAGYPEPDFLPHRVAVEVQRSQTVFERRKWSLYFEKWGCRMCSRKNVAHASSGCCNRCHGLVADRLRVIKAQFDRDNPEAEIMRQIDLLTRPMRTAKKLLEPFTGGDD